MANRCTRKRAINPEQKSLPTPTKKLAEIKDPYIILYPDFLGRIQNNRKIFDGSYIPRLGYLSIPGPIPKSNRKTRRPAYVSGAGSLATGDYTVVVRRAYTGNRTLRTGQLDGNLTVA